MLAFWASHVTSACHFSTCCNHKYRKLQIRSWEKRKKKNDEAETSDNDFRKVAQRKAEANSRNISVGWQCRRYRAQKRTTGRVRSVHFIGRIFMERRHELAANSMNVWWSESDRSEVAESPLSFSLSLSPPPILATITSLVDQMKGSLRGGKPRRERKIERVSDWQEKSGIETIDRTMISIQLEFQTLEKFDFGHDSLSVHYFFLLFFFAI